MHFSEVDNLLAGSFVTEVDNLLAGSFAHECNKNNTCDTMSYKQMWHSKSLTNQLQYISLFVDIN